MHPPNKKKTKNIYNALRSLNFPRILESVDFYKRFWKNYLTVYHGQFKGMEKLPTVTMESFLDKRLWTLNVFLGIPGFNNGITLFQSSTVHTVMSNGTFPRCAEFVFNFQARIKQYLLADWIYPKGLLFVHIVTSLSTKEESFAPLYSEDSERSLKKHLVSSILKFTSSLFPVSSGASGKWRWSCFDAW